MRLDGKVALVTGGGSGIGAAIARKFVEEGAKVCITGRRKEMLEKVAGTLPAGTMIICPGDVGSRVDAERMVSTAVDFGGGLDILVNNAGIGVHGSVTEIPVEDWMHAFDVNIHGPFLLMKAAIPYMIKAGGGSIVNVASLAGIRSIPAGAAYCASKAGLIHLSRQVALDYGPAKVRCNVICPGAVWTPMLEGAMGNLKEAIHTDIEGAGAYFVSCSPLRRVGDPSEIASVCTFLACEDSSYMTGTVLVADGGAAIVDVNGAVVNMIGNK
ncbi:MAG: SDR family oxidoreductase [Dehalococcoidales bacterium]|nr:SDR family oxidoreductase [Dehalococcoidales bacterium]